MLKYACACNERIQEELKHQLIEPECSLKIPAYLPYSIPNVIASPQKSQMEITWPYRPTEAS